MIAGERPACSRGQVSGESGVGRGVGRMRPSRPHSRAHSACGPFLSLCRHLCSTSRKTFLDLRSFLRDPPLCCFPYSRQGFSWAVLELTLWAMRLALPLSAGERCAQPLPRQVQLVLERTFEGRACCCQGFMSLRGSFKCRGRCFPIAFGQEADYKYQTKAVRAVQ